MGVKPFNAETWFRTGHSPKQTAAGAEEKSISSFFIPGWKGESLISKPAIRLKKILDDLHTAAIAQLNAFQSVNRSLKQNIYREFLSYVNAHNEKCHELDNYNTFWSHLKNPDSKYQPILSTFIDLYGFRVATIYLFKIRFILQLSNAIGIKANLTNYLNPTAFLNNIFQKGSSRELMCPSLQTNQYSWFRPTEKLHQQLLPLGQIFDLVSINEMMKICTYKTVEKNAIRCNHNYSHSLSHKAFGVFINDLILKFPQWLKQDNKTKLFGQQKSEYPKVINCKFTGDYLISFTISHWLAQEHEIDMKWSEIISPEFTGCEFENGDYVKYCHELQFLAYLVVIAEKQELEPITLICQVMGKGKENYSSQIPMFPTHRDTEDRVYDRIILNAAELPKKNPHHNLTTQINSQIDHMKKGGFLYVMTNQNFFVNSRSQKIEQLLGHLKLEGFFDFNSIKGKGEIPGYLYIFSKRIPLNKQAFLNSVYTSSLKKESCLTFKLSGNLSLFNKFFNFVDELENFFNHKNAYATPIYQKEIDEKILFEYYQDAIVDGKLLQCSSQDPSKITHPNFFRNLTKSCIPFGNFFRIEHINPNTKKRTPSDYLGHSLLNSSLPIEQRFPLILIVDQTDAQNVRLEIIKSENYQAKHEKYGTAFFQYFGISPKFPNLNINLFKDFFANSIGKQIIQLSLNEGTTKLKSKLQSLLIPKFFSVTTPLPEHLENNLQFLKTESCDILSNHPEELGNSFSHIKDYLQTLGKNYPWHVMSLLTYFKYNIEKCIDQFCAHDQDLSNIVNYNNPLVIEPLIKLKSHHIYPNNPEVYVEVLAKSPQDIHRPLSYSESKTNDNNHYIELYSQNTAILQIYCGTTTLSFIKYILSSAIGAPISTILESLTVPTEEDLSSVLSRFSEMSSVLHQLQKDSEQELTNILNAQISS